MQWARGFGVVLAWRGIIAWCAARGGAWRGCLVAHHVVHSAGTGRAARGGDVVWLPGSVW